MKKNIHIVPHQDGWAVKREKAERASSLHQLKSDAIDAGRELAKTSKGELRIHRKDGKITDSDSYGKDPYPPRDRKH